MLCEPKGVYLLRARGWLLANAKVVADVHEATFKLETRLGARCQRTPHCKLAPMWRPGAVELLLPLGYQKHSVNELRAAQPQTLMRPNLSPRVA